MRVAGYSNRFRAQIGARQDETMLVETRRAFAETSSSYHIKVHPVGSVVAHTVKGYKGGSRVLLGMKLKRSALSSDPL